MQVEIMLVLGWGVRNGKRRVLEETFMSIKDTDLKSNV